MTTTSTLSGRDRAILRAVAAGGAQLQLGSEPDLFLDGRCCCDQAAAHHLFRTGLITAATLGRIGQSHRVRRIPGTHRFGAAPRPCVLARNRRAVNPNLHASRSDPRPAARRSRSTPAAYPRRCARRLPQPEPIGLLSRWMALLIGGPPPGPQRTCWPARWR